MMNIIYLGNATAAAVFDMVLSAAFCDIRWTRRKGLLTAGCMALILIFQGIIYSWGDSDAVEYLHPLITHLPLTVLLCFLNKKVLWPAIAVLTAYLCCQIRRWQALFIVTVFAGGPMMQHTAELLMTLPVLLILLRFAAPSVRSISNNAFSMQVQFGLAPALYYGFDYLTGNNIEMSSLEQMQEILNLQVAEAVREIEALRKSQQKTRIYRHDLRHHMQYLLSCIENGRFEQARGYIREIYPEIETNHVTVYCENEAINLIFSAFSGRAEDCGVPMKIQAAFLRNIAISESDLCVLLSNALENALHACMKQKEKGASGTIEVLAYEKKGKFFLQIINSCDDAITFENGVPVTGHPGHGTGVRSICAIVEKYGGIYTYSAKDGKFILRVSL